MKHRFLARFLTLGLLAGLALTAPRAQAADPQALSAARVRLQSGIHQGRADLALEARDQFAVLAAAEPNVALLHYWVAVSGWRAFPLLMRAKSNAAAEAALDHAFAAVDRALALDPRLAEALALKSGLTGMRIQLGGMTEGFTLGPVMSGLEGQAEAIAPESPRVLFLVGLNTFHKPGFVGGGAKKALAKFEAAIAAFANEAASGGLQPDWGRDDAELWAGRACMELKDWSGAREHFGRVLATNPDYGWVKQLIAELDQKSRGAKKS